MNSTLIIIPAAFQEAANAIAAIYDPEGGEHTFTIGLSASGEVQATHFWCSGRLSSEMVAAIKVAAPGAVVEQWDMANADFPSDLLNQLGLQRIIGDDNL